MRPIHNFKWKTPEQWTDDANGNLIPNTNIKEVLKMEKETKKPNKGTWDRLGNEDMPRTDRISFEINIPVEVTFACDAPEEKPSEEPNMVYYEFAVWQDSVPKVIQTSAWTLLAELKKLWPLNGKKVRITKKMEKGRQYFEVVKL